MAGISGRIATALRNAATRLEQGGFRALFRGNLKAVKNAPTEVPATNPSETLTSSDAGTSFQNIALGTSSANLKPTTDGLALIQKNLAEYQSKHGEDAEIVSGTLIPRARLGDMPTIFSKTESSVDFLSLPEDGAVADLSDISYEVDADDISRDEFQAQALVDDVNLGAHAFELDEVSKVPEEVLDLHSSLEGDLDSLASLDMPLDSYKSESAAKATENKTSTDSFLIGKNNKKEVRLLLGTIKNEADINRSLQILNLSPEGKKVKYRDSVSDITRQEIKKLQTEILAHQKTIQRAEKQGVSTSLARVESALTELKEKRAALGSFLNTLDARSLALSMSNFNDVEKELSGLKKASPSFRHIAASEAITLAKEYELEASKKQGESYLAKISPDKKLRKTEAKLLEVAQQINAKAIALRAFAARVEKTEW